MGQPAGHPQGQGPPVEPVVVHPRPPLWGLWAAACCRPWLLLLFTFLSSYYIFNIHMVLLPVRLLSLSYSLSSALLAISLVWSDKATRVSLMFTGWSTMLIECRIFFDGCSFSRNGFHWIDNYFHCLC